MPSPVAGFGETKPNQKLFGGLRSGGRKWKRGDTITGYRLGGGHEQGESRVQGTEGLCLLCRALSKSLMGMGAVGKDLKMRK